MCLCASITQRRTLQIVSNRISILTLIYADSNIVQSLDANAFGENAVLGCDFVGTVEALGAEVSLLEIGDTVAGLVWGGISRSK